MEGGFLQDTIIGKVDSCKIRLQGRWILAGYNGKESESLHDDMEGGFLHDHDPLSMERCKFMQDDRGLL
ncbi:unnamed protein product [Cercopithifilaria johnstoni]|uniref:Uncharacterized protein n=1 Tax=Cercopithifilaria johnstoni TaxID=2874296 RepID=A0A8J2MCY6_9BILA|nr:unnamed protein product [Cercopithifilaria johnstoni]